MGTRSYVGVSSATSWRYAGCQACLEALFPFGSGKPKVLLVLCCGDVNYEKVYTGIRDVCDVPVFGAVFDYLFAWNGLLKSGVAVCAIDLEGEVLHPLIVPQGKKSPVLPKGFAESVQKAGAIYGNTFFLLFTNQYIYRWVQLIYDTFGTLSPIVGAGGAKVFHNEMEIDGSIAIPFVSSESLKMAIGHGFEPIGRPLVITNVRDNCILEIDGIHAADAFSQFLKEYGLEETLPLTTSIPYTFGFPNVGENYLIHDACWTEANKGYFEFPVEIPDRSITRVMVTEGSKLLSSSEQVISQYCSQFARKSSFNLVVDCVGRIDVLGSDVEKESALFKKAFGENHYLALASRLEIGAPKGMPVYCHNKSLIIAGME